MHDQELIGGHTKEIVRLIGKSAQMPQPLRADLITKIPGEMPLYPNVPWRDDQSEDRKIFPSQQSAKSHSRFAIEDCEDKKNRGRINNAQQAFGQAGESRANPNACEPNAAATPAL